MAAVVPKLSPMETRKDMCKRILGFIIKMTSGVVYSIVMHSVIITAYALVICRTFYTNEYDLDRLIDDIFNPIIFAYLLFGLVEVGVRRIYNEDPLTVTKSGHFTHFYASFMLATTYMIPSTPIESLVYCFVGASLVVGTIFVLLDVVFLALLEDESLTQPLV